MSAGRTPIEEVRALLTHLDDQIDNRAIPVGDKMAYIQRTLPTLQAYALASIAESLAQLVELTAERT